MSDTSGILIKKPVALLNRNINFNFGSFFTALTKAGANAAVMNFGNVPENLVEVAAAVGLGKEPGEVAWVLIFRALIQAMWTLAEERKDLLQDADNKDIEIIVNHRLEECLKKLESEEITIDINFFDHPESLVIVEEVKTPFAQWLESFGVKICSDNSHFQNLFAEYQQAAEAGITRLLTAFYFRQSGVREQEKTFEFTHKSFGEYLTARRIVRELDFIHEQLAERQKNRRKGWDEKEALKQWAILCGTSPLNEYLFSFIFDEIRLQALENVEEWQQTLCNLISFMLREGMPMEELKLPNFYEENRQARNAEEALLVVLNACARVTEKVSEIKWHSPEDFGVWISRLGGQRLDYDNQIFCLNYLSYLDLQKCILIHQDFYKANLQRADLQGANLQGANLVGTILEGKDLTNLNTDTDSSTV